MADEGGCFAKWSFETAIVDDHNFVERGTRPVAVEHH
jgi:hypothetical protein